jgi:RHS repeat-associated protein
MLASAPNSRPVPLPLSPALLAAELGPVVMADDPCEAAFSGPDPTGPSKYYRARYLDPNTGRFVSEDPITFVGGMNFYTYVGANPATFGDPLGLCAMPPGTLDCLQNTFPGERPGTVKVEHRPKANPKFAADTRANSIRVYVDCNAFWKDCDTVLEEYFHVLKQWRKKRFFKVRYLANSFAKLLLPGQDKYWDNKYEKEAQKVAKDRCEDFAKCCQTCSCATP